MNFISDECICKQNHVKEFSLLTKLLFCIFHPQFYCGGWVSVSLALYQVNTFSSEKKDRRGEIAVNGDVLGWYLGTLILKEFSVLVLKLGEEGYCTLQSEYKCMFSWANLYIFHSTDFRQ